LATARLTVDIQQFHYIYVMVLKCACMVITFRADEAITSVVFLIGCPPSVELPYLLPPKICPKRSRSNPASRLDSPALSPHSLKSFFLSAFRKTAMSPTTH